ncbi:FMRFamide-related peptides [Anopheles nili]|uniref:FMRFamide-related peptides n=1 Tax=Anopheles nili TaxID=185578 RepID=UPI00237A38D6|nr:FMRFamide-related peptides [Anopheles nili]
MFPCADSKTSSSSNIGGGGCTSSSIMKFYLFVAIVVCESCNYFSRAEYDAIGELVGPGHRLALEEYRETGYEPWYPWAGGTVKRNAKSDIQTRRRSALDKNFMRFGRSDRDISRQTRANLMRFGRPDRNFLRFGRDSRTYEIEGREDDLSKEYATSTEQLEPLVRGDESSMASKRNSAGGTSEEMFEGTDLSESGEQIKPKQIVYYRRDSPKNLMRFGKRRSGSSGYMRFGRAGNLMRFGRSGDEPSDPFGRSSRFSNPMRFGRAGNLMRFGRTSNKTRVAISVSNATGQPPSDTLPPNLHELFEKKPAIRELQEAIEVAEMDDSVPLYIVDK